MTTKERMTLAAQKHGRQLEDMELDTIAGKNTTMAHSFSYRGTGRRIRSQRIQQRLTQAAVAEMADISASFVGAIERGEKKMSVETFAKLADCLQVSTEYLLFGQWEMCRSEGCSLCSDISDLLLRYHFPRRLSC